ncbi:hypothetical protein CRG98_008766 [Punica granatum]|uniref:Uncharacterized protein n=1 Tax=Punica granatum TaxID=22663 RepID=A0A2I0KQU9_PUNGR|nr:hypothetical protein CRG98_008766 [Punica granatum]
MKEHELFKISMQECREANWFGRRRANTPRDVHWYVELACMGWCEHAWTCVRRARSLVDAWGHTERCASDHAVTLSVRKKLVLVSLAWEGGSALGLRLPLSWRKGEDRKWLARENWHDLPVVRGGPAAVQT